MTVVGLKRLERRFKKIPSNVRQQTARAMERGADRLVSEMIRLAPEDEAKLIASINWTWAGGGPGALTTGNAFGVTFGTTRITVSAGDESTLVDGASQQFQNARLQEFGTVNMTPRPYFFVSWRKLRRGIRSGITRSMRAAIRSS